MIEEELYIEELKDKSENKKKQQTKRGTEY